MKKVKFLSAFWLALLLIAGAAESLAQTYNYQMTLTPRRMGNQLGVEIWVRSLSPNAGPLGAMNIGVSYNGAKLQAANFSLANQPSSKTDAIQFDVDAPEPLPYYIIESEFHNKPARGFAALSGTSVSGLVGGTMRYVAVLDVNVTSTLGPGFAPASTGRGSFIGLLRFNILNADALTDADLAEFRFNPYTSLNTTVVMSGDGLTNVTNQVEFVNPTPFTIRGITVLNPNQLNQTVNRYPESPYLSMRANRGYPIYFERSGLATPTLADPYGTRRFAYRLEYSLDGGTTYTEFGRVAESRDKASLIATADLPTYRLGWIDSLDVTDDYFVTTGNVDPIPTDVAAAFLQDEPDGPGLLGWGYGGVLRVIWKADDNFPFRSENAKIRITQLDGTSGSLAESNRPAYTSPTRMDESDETFILGRLFFVQFDGATTYFRSVRNFSTPNSFTVEAWVNLNVSNGVGTNPGIVAASSGNASQADYGWMLYLRDGIYPAFRVTAADGSVLGDVVCPAPLVAYGNNPNLTDQHSLSWTHLAGVVSNNTVILYVDGEEVARYVNRSAPNIRPLNVKMPIWVGVNPNNGMQPQDYFYGGIKEVKVWRVALEQSQLRRYIPGVYDPNGSITAITDGPNDWRTGLELYFPLQASRLDKANEKTYQQSNNDLNFFTTPGLTSTPNNNSIRYRPDRSHIKLTSPNGGEGVSNLKGKIYEIRWVSYGIGSLTPKPTATYGDVMIQISRDGGNTWFDALDNQTPAMPIDNAEVEDAYAYWEPYNNVTISGLMNDLQGVIPFVGNYEKNVLMRISGSEARNQQDIYYISQPFKVAPWFAYKNGQNSIVSIPANTKLNITGETFFLETWIKPYSFPQNTEGNYYPIVAKKNPNAATEAEALQYALRLLSTGQLQFVVSSLDNGTRTLRTAVSDPIYRILNPNTVEFDSVWIHVGVWVNIPSVGSQSQILFFVDGVPQLTWTRNDALEATNPIMRQLGTGITVDKTNSSPVYIGYEPVVGTNVARRFDGEFRELRFWGGNPGGVLTTDEMIKFVQGATNVRASELGVFGGVDYTKNLIAAYSFNGNSWVNYGKARAFEMTPYDADLVARINPDPTANYESTTPFIKLVEPVYLQAVKNTETALKVRWVGFDYNRNDGVAFSYGTSSKQADLEFSTGGGAGNTNVPYQFVSSVYQNAGYTNALTLPTATSEYEFMGVASKPQYAGILNCSIADPDANKDGVYNDQSVIGAAMTNGRLRLRARANINTPYAFEYDNGSDGFMQTLITESAQFNITPPSNFTVRVLLDGYHGGYASGIINNIGTNFANKGLRIRLFEDNSGVPGSYVPNSTVLSTDKYYNFTQSKLIINRNGGANNFANVPFVLTDVADGRYFVVIDHLNYLPVMSAYAAPFYYVGDNLSSWDIESGWDFQAWDGTDNNLITSTEARQEPPAYGTRYTAYADEQNYTPDRYNSKWASTGLNFNDGGAANNITSPNSLPAMVGGDVYRDGQINAADRAKVRVNALSTDASNDVNGDNVANAIDRTIVDNNTNKVSSLRNLALNTQYVYPQTPNSIESNPFSYISDADPMSVYYPLAPELSKRFVVDAKLYLNEGGEVHSSTIISKYDQTLSGGLSYRVIAMPQLNGNFVDVPIYIRNTGADFALANATFAINFDPTVVRFAELVKVNEVIFDNRFDLGYGPIYTSPTNLTDIPVPNTRSIEVDWDAYTRRPGQIVPRVNTYLGTLRFELLRKDQSIFFNWSNTCAVLSTDGKIITGVGVFEDIKPIIITKNFAVVAPNGGEVWEGGSMYTINWTAPLDVEGVSLYLEYSADNGASWVRINQAPVDALKLGFNWIAPRLNSGEMLVRLLDAATGKELDRSDAVFTIFSVPAEITRPASTDPIYTSGKKDFIRWTSKDNANVRFEFSANGVDGWTVVTGTVNTNKEEVEWTIPAANTKNAVVRMVDVATGKVLAVSEPFRILSGTLVITNPRANDKLNFGEKRPVRWVHENVNTFTLQYSIDNGATWNTLAGDFKASLRSFDWMVPNVNTKNAWVRAIYANIPELEYHRSGPFEIKGSVTGIDDPVALGYNVEVVPNPFADEAKVTFTIPTDGNVSVSLYNTMGIKVASLISSKFYSAGSHTLSLSGMNLASGMYIVRIEAGPYVITREVVRVK